MRGPGRTGITGLILAGGQGRRMGGVDKGLLELQGRPLVAHVHARFAPQVHSVWISANRNQGLYAAWAERVVPDLPGLADCGPLGGIAAALAAVDTPWLASVACDMPHLPEDLVARLADTVGAGAPAAVAEAAGRLHPVCMLVPATLGPGLQAWLAGGERRVQAWLQKIGAARVAFPDEHTFANVNTPDDLRRQDTARPA
ncbi:molybdenum cofactor guanylyltransferase [Verticiella sediminum]|uniref:Molybdenum cofactor guanylyltransferase n=1 Tax=Verticiella sediminum TaxID=1247510 RepID=A0A556A8F9_9BURK|nr:molybdenum cofactor guanylyltransferase MobA [Verticiella sediminum]TSH89176.1 molybdenum cofactor guanylyltransferase [Verticiella sediminum]